MSLKNTRLTPLCPDAVEKSDPCLAAFSLSLLDNFLKRPPKPAWAGSGGADFFLAYKRKRKELVTKLNITELKSEVQNKAQYTATLVFCESSIMV